jgi:hypothetical protein
MSGMWLSGNDRPGRLSARMLLHGRGNEGPAGADHLPAADLPASSGVPVRRRSRESIGADRGRWRAACAEWH